MNGVSVVICCYNSSERIARTMEHLLWQEKISKEDWEIILVDNNCTDDTVEVANELYDKFKTEKPSFAVVPEKNAGLSFARKKGILMSKFSYVLFCDDDNWFCSDYLSKVLAIMRSDDNIGVLGGMGFPVFEGTEPPFFWKNQYHTLAVGPQWVEEGDITNTRGVVYGAGMTINKECYSKLVNEYMFDFQATDRIGNSLISCGDHELCLAVKKIKYKIVWDNGLTFMHYIPKSRTSLKYYKRLFLGYGMSLPMLIGYDLKKGEFNNFKTGYIYLSLRYLKNVLKSYFKLLTSGFYFKSYNDKYGCMDIIQALYSNYGALLITLKYRNFYKIKFAKTRLYSLND